MEVVKIKENAKASPLETAKENNRTVTTELHFELLKQYAWLASAIIGAVIVMVQLKAIEMGMPVYISVGLLVASIFFSLIGQDYIVDSLLEGKDIFSMSKILKRYRYASLILLSVGAGFTTSILIGANT